MLLDMDGKMADGVVMETGGTGIQINSILMYGKIEGPFPHKLDHLSSHKQLNQSHFLHTIKLRKLQDH